MKITAPFAAPNKIRLIGFGTRPYAGRAATNGAPRSIFTGLQGGTRPLDELIAPYKRVQRPRSTSEAEGKALDSPPGFWVFRPSKFSNHHGQYQVRYQSRPQVAP